MHIVDYPLNTLQASEFNVKIPRIVASNLFKPKTSPVVSGFDALYGDKRVVQLIQSQQRLLKNYAPTTNRSATKGLGLAGESGVSFDEAFEYQFPQGEEISKSGLGLAGGIQRFDPKNPPPPGTKVSWINPNTGRESAAIYGGAKKKIIEQGFFNKHLNPWSDGNEYTQSTHYLKPTTGSFAGNDIVVINPNGTQKVIPRIEMEAKMRQSIDFASEKSSRLVQAGRTLNEQSIKDQQKIDQSIDNLQDRYTTKAGLANVASDMALQAGVGAASGGVAGTKSIGLFKGALLNGTAGSVGASARTVAGGEISGKGFAADALLFNATAGFVTGSVSMAAGKSGLPTYLNRPGWQVAFGTGAAASTGALAGKDSALGSSNIAQEGAGFIAGTAVTGAGMAVGAALGGPAGAAVGRAVGGAGSVLAADSAKAAVQFGQTINNLSNAEGSSALLTEARNTQNTEIAYKDILGSGFLEEPSGTPNDDNNEPLDTPSSSNEPESLSSSDY